MSDGYRTDENPFAADDQAQQHLMRAMEIIEKSAFEGEMTQREVYDATAHLRIAAVQGIVGGWDDE